METVPRRDKGILIESNNIGSTIISELIKIETKD